MSQNTKFNVFCHFNLLNKLLNVFWTMFPEISLQNFWEIVNLTDNCALYVHVHVYVYLTKS